MVRDPKKELAELNWNVRQNLEDSLAKREAELKELRSKKKSSSWSARFKRAQVRINAKERQARHQAEENPRGGLCCSTAPPRTLDSAPASQRDSLDAFLERDRDRELFDLPPKEAAHGNPS